MDQPIPYLLSYCLRSILSNIKKYNEEQLSIIEIILKNMYKPIYERDYINMKIDYFCENYSSGAKVLLYNKTCYFYDVSTGWRCQCKFITEKKYGKNYQLYWISKCCKCSLSKNNSFKTINNKLNENM